MPTQAKAALMLSLLAAAINFAFIIVWPTGDRSAVAVTRPSAKLRAVHLGFRS